MKKLLVTILLVFTMILTFAACGDNTNTLDDIPDVQTENQVNIQEDHKENEAISTTESDSISTAEQSESAESKGEKTEMKLNVQIGDYNFTATLEKNVAVEEFVDMINEGPVSIQMDDYSGFEKVGSLGKSLTSSNSRTTTVSGDIVLYNGSNIVMFYGSNSWSYTRIGKIDDLTDWEKALGSGSITAVFTIAE